MNMLCLATLMILGQTTSPTSPTVPGGPTPAPSGAAGLFPVALMMALIVFLFLTTRSQRRREQRERNELNSRMKKGDRVLTAGGAIGTILSVRDDEVVLKVDETTNTKMTFLKSAIQRILED